MYRAVAFVVLLASGCLTAEEQRLRDACGGERPLRGYCTYGLGWADCEGTEDEPRLGCDDVSCRWFDGGCVPKGHRPSECPPDDSCCVEDAVGRLGPFSGERTGAGPDYLFAGLGTEPWTPEREQAQRTVTVTLAEVDGEVHDVVCSSEGTLHRDLCSCPELPEGYPDVRQFVGEDGESFWVWIAPSCVAERTAEFGMRVTRDSRGDPRAWVCMFPRPDESGSGAIETSPDPCANAGTPVCAESGELTFPAFPRTQADLDAMAFELSVTFDDGRTMELRF